MNTSLLRSGSWLSTSSGIDWLSCSAPRCDEHDALWTRGGELLAAEEAEGNRVKPWRSHGLVGLVCGSVVRAVSPTHYFLQLSSERARTAAHGVLPLAGHTSRLDLQVTAQTPGEAPYDAARAAYRAREARRRGGRPLTRTHLYSTNGGATCYLGRRVSDAFGRVYDKGVEDKAAPAGTLWRWELELKRDVANLTALELLAVEDVEAAAAGLIRSTFAEWGVTVPTAAASIRKPSAQSPRSDADRLLGWLATGVRPSVEFLLRAGRHADVLRALGLPPTTDSIRSER